ncbi:diacylglycerol kinase family protein [Streptomyces sp. NPDC047123]|uniref:diacylglycerol kinase family protein n=1 Tax=Streptomyces sp. NPDC047123 TaxID=3155622 RepID=UPI0033C720D3
MAGLGLLITGPAREWWPVVHEDAVNEALERGRTGTLTTISFVVSEAGNTATVVAITSLVCLGLLLVPRAPRWREAGFLAAGVTLQSLVFLLITLTVDRHRPDVDRLDASPPTSSYTSGHTGAATALYAGLAVLVSSRMRGPWRRIVAGLLLLLPLLVALARLYRGMHHPTDVMGGLLNGSLSLLIVGRAILPLGETVDRPRAADTVMDTFDNGRVRLSTGAVVVVFNPLAVGTSTLAQLRTVLIKHGHPDACFRATTAADPGHGQTAAARAAGASLVVVCGGDGTVGAAADALAGSDIPLVVVPCGTGNLLARNLRLPLSPAAALDAALGGSVHRLDLGRIAGDGMRPLHFTAMAGAGLDAEVMRHTRSRAKSLIGWPAYALSVLRRLRSPRMTMTIRADDAPAMRRTARMVLIANVGTVQGGISLVPAARPDDGLLDLLILDPHGPLDWLRLLAGLRRPAADASARTGTCVEYATFRRLTVDFDATQPREVDGDPVPNGRRLRADVCPGALAVLLPAEEN